MIVTTGNEIIGQTITGYCGIVRGITVRIPTWGQGFAAGLQSFGGGNVEAYAEQCDMARQDAYDRMIAHATELRADAIIAFRYDATELGEHVSEVLAYGTAVTLEIGGVGLRFEAQIDDALVIDLIVAGGGADQAGLLVGDRIYTIDGVSAVTLGAYASIDRLRGKPGTSVELAVRRNGQPLTFTVDRQRR